MPIYVYIIIDVVNEGQLLMTASVKCGWGIQKLIYGCFALTEKGKTTGWVFVWTMTSSPSECSADERHRRQLYGDELGLNRVCYTQKIRMFLSKVRPD